MLLLNQLKPISMKMNKITLLLRVIIPITFYYWNIPTFGQNPSGQNANTKIILSYFDEVVNTHKMSRMGEFFSQDYIWHQMDGKEAHSRQDSSHVSMLKFIFKAIPDIQYTVDNTVAEGDMVAVNSTVTGTAMGEFFGYMGSQKKVQFKQMFFFRLLNNKIIEEWEVVDIAGIKEQLSRQ
jgi:steroid delta-isomerase-like uncharacterized protein